MTVEEAVKQCAFWTPNMEETVFMGSTTDEEIAGVFGCTVSMPRQAWSDPKGARNYDVRVSRFLRGRDDTGEPFVHDNPIALLLIEEIEERRAAGLRG